MEIDEISEKVIDSAIAIHRGLDPGLLECAYETVLAASFQRMDLKVDRQMPVDIHYDGMRVRQIGRVHGKELLTYLRLINQPVGLLLNFSGATMKEGLRRVVNGYRHPHPQSPSASPVSA